MRANKKVYDIRSEVIGYDPDKKTVTLKLIDDVDFEKAKELFVDGHLYSYLDLYNQNNITDEQRMYFWALMGDFMEHTGYPKLVSGANFRLEFMIENGLKEYPSTKRNGMTKDLASHLIEYTLNGMIDLDIPFFEHKFHLARHTNNILLSLTMKKLCWRCGSPNSDLHHYEAIGMGRDRTKIDHTRHHFITLCREHHQEIHSMGGTDFCKKYHLQPIKLSKENLKKLRVQGKYKE